jgi:hypothetical protein
MPQLQDLTYCSAALSFPLPLLRVDPTKSISATICDILVHLVIHASYSIEYVAIEGEEMKNVIF